jgi:hypothetical protein
MMVDFDSENFLKRRFYALNARIAELKHLIAIGENDVIMLLVLKSTFVMR